MMSEYSGYVQKLKEEGTLNYFYVYAYLRTDGTPYYIGKGQGYRIHDKYGHILPPKDRRVKIKENLFEDEALELEAELILKYGRKKYDKGGILYNDSIGGEGRTVWRTLEEKKKSKSESDKRYRENPKYREGLLQRKKEYHEKHKEERNRKMRELRATPEGKAKKAAMDKAYYIKVRQDPVKLEVDRKRKREHAYKKAREEGKPTKEECGRKFKVVSPDGKVYEGIQCKPFAEKHNLDPTCFTAMVRGDINHHNGWTVYGFKPPEGKKQRSNGGYFPTRIKNSKQFLFKMIDPQGNIHEGFNQREFAEKHGLDYKKVNAVLKGRRNHTGGWRKV
tara:strand:- start:44 stop:1045 length:1002 start_codon:yes stop_codon:yes gene_type:complete